VDPQAVEDAVQIGLTLVAAGRYQESIDLFSAVIEARPDEYRAFYGTALASLNLGQTTTAEANARAALVALSRKENIAPTAKYGKADALVLLGVILAVKGDNGAALSSVTEAARLAPESFDAQFALGRALFGAGNPASAAVAFQRAVTLQPANSSSRFFLATALEATGDYEGARKTYSELIALQPNKAEGHLGLGVLLIKLGGENTEQGIQELQKAILFNDSYEARVTLGRAQVKAGRFSEAVENLTRAAELAPNNPEPHYQLAIAYSRLGKKAEAERASARVKEINSQRRGTDVNMSGNKSPH